MQTSERGLQLIKTSEGFVAHVYIDIDAPAIAYGHRLLPGESFPDGLTLVQGEELLCEDLAARYEPMLNPRIPDGCTQGQYDALIDFVYNIKDQPKSLEELLAHGWDQVPAQLLRWCHVKDPVTGQMKENAGLLARRKEEAQVFLS